MLSENAKPGGLIGRQAVMIFGREPSRKTAAIHEYEQMVQSSTAIKLINPASGTDDGAHA